MSESNFPLESLLSARQLLATKIHEDRIYFISNLSGQYSLYFMDKKGSIPTPLLPEGIALQNPHLMQGENYLLVPKMDQIIVMIDNNGDELYQPNIIPMTGGIPQPLFGDEFKGMQVLLGYIDPVENIVFLMVDDRKSPGYELFKVDLQTKEKTSYGISPTGRYLAGVSEDNSKVCYAEGYGAEDTVLYEYLDDKEDNRVVMGKPMEEREPDEQVKNGVRPVKFVEDDNVILFSTILFDDKRSIAWMKFSDSNNPTELPIKGYEIPEIGEMEGFGKITDKQFYIKMNVDGATKYYLAKYHPGDDRHLEITTQLVGKVDTPLEFGVLLDISYDKLKAKKTGLATEFVASFTSATSPSQIYLISTDDDTVEYTRLSHEKVLGIPKEYLSEGEDASYKSFDGLRISARLYLPSEELDFEGPRPLVLYIHGGPQSQEKPDFTWFSMPLIQYLTLNGFAVFVPNVRGSTGYGYEYQKKVEKDWGGDDVKDHIHALSLLEEDERIDSSNRFVVGRSYGGYMTLTLISRHPKLFNAGCDMFGPYDLIGFINRLPPSWATMFKYLLGDVEEDREFLIERSPKTYFDQIEASLLVIQGANDPRVTLEESKEVFEDLQDMGKDVELLVFEDEGHDVIKFDNKMKCYQRITDFFLENIS